MNALTRTRSVAVLAALATYAMGAPDAAASATPKSQWGCAAGSFCVWDNTNGWGNGDYIDYSGGKHSAITNVWSFWNNSGCKAWMVIDRGDHYVTNQVPGHHRYPNQHNYPVVTLLMHC